MNSNSTNAIEEGSLISLHFSLELSSGETIDSNFSKKPASFRLGDGNMLPGFEAELMGLSEGGEVDVILEPACAFGEINPSNVHLFPVAKFKSLLEDELMPAEVGSVVSFKDAGGFDLPGVVSKLTEQSVEVDFNHPLAGKKIAFRARILSVIAPDVSTLEIKL